MKKVTLYPSLYLGSTTHLFPGSSWLIFWRCNHCTSEINSRWLFCAVKYSAGFGQQLGKFCPGNSGNNPPCTLLLLYFHRVFGDFCVVFWCSWPDFMTWFTLFHFWAILLRHGLGWDSTYGLFSFPLIRIKNQDQDTTVEIMKDSTSLRICSFYSWNNNSWFPVEYECSNDGCMKPLYSLCIISSQQMWHLKQLYRHLQWSQQFMSGRSYSDLLL